MKKSLKLRTFRYGDPPKRGEGLAIGTTRRPPRGATKKEWSYDFDVWFPVVAPSAALLSRYKGRDFSDLAIRQRFFRSYEREVYSRAESRQALQLLARIALRTAISVGCYCENESHCHRSDLRKLIEREARRL